ncbi:MAG: ABC transporter permease [Gemmataceae bacterium]|nr:ABC transporter permease [Gemmataceae bacterium]
MTPLAILKDSIRENRDSKILLVLMILSLLFSFFLLSMSFEPVSFDKMLVKTDEVLPLEVGNRAKFANFQKFNFQAKTTDFQTIEAARNPANGKYKFRLTIESGQKGRIYRSFAGPIIKDDPELENLPNVKDPKEKSTGEDPFVVAVYLWNTDKTGERNKFLTGFGGDAANQKISITPEQMMNWVKEIYDFHLNTKIDKVTLLPQTKPNEYVFEVETGKSAPRQWPHGIQLFFGGVDLEKIGFPPIALGQLVYIIQNYLINGFGAAVAILLGIIITSFFIPNMLRKGTIDILLSKPLTRSALLVYKFLGGLFFMFLFSLVAVGTVYLALAIRTGLWNPAPLLLIPLLTYSFAVLYSVSTLVAVLTRNATAAMLVTLVFSALLWVLSVVYNRIEADKKRPVEEQALSPRIHLVADIADKILPKTRDLDLISTKILMGMMTETDQKKMRESQLNVSWEAAFGVSGLYIVGFVGLSCWIFSRKNF